uniref:Calpain catalytic domain-containing protein n=1 Tax=Hucho hucho TaxID=62062 RepID=A0A4W5KVJ4_9TELE
NPLYENVMYLNQDFQSLRSECLRKGSIFTDCTFPAAPESLGFKELGPNSSKTRGVQWKRPGVSYYASYTHCIYAWLKCLLYD